MFQFSINETNKVHQCTNIFWEIALHETLSTDSILLTNTIMFYFNCILLHSIFNSIFFFVTFAFSVILALIVQQKYFKMQIANYLIIYTFKVSYLILINFNLIFLGMCQFAGKQVRSWKSIGRTGNESRPTEARPLENDFGQTNFGVRKEGTSEEDRRTREKFFGNQIGKRRKRQSYSIAQIATWRDFKKK